MKPGSVKKINTGAMAFKCMENINAFLEVAREMGVPAQETFQTVDLWERQNLNSVVICIQSLGRKVKHTILLSLLLYTLYLKFQLGSEKYFKYLKVTMYYLKN